MKAIDGLLAADRKMTEATEGHRAKFEKVQITEGQALGVHMVDFKQPNAEIEEVERCIKMEREHRRGGYYHTPIFDLRYHIISLTYASLHH